MLNLQYLYMYIYSVEKINKGFCTYFNEKSLLLYLDPTEQMHSLKETEQESNKMF